MRHDPDDLAASALDHDDVGVLPDDPDDRADLAAYRRVVAAGRTLGPDDVATEDPPADLWDRIAGSIHDDPPAEQEPVVLAPSSPTGRTPDADVDVGVEHAPAAGGQVVRLDSRRRAWKVVAAVAAAAVLVAGIGVVAVNRSSGSGTELVASTDLSLLEGGGSGSAELLKRSDGMHLVVDVSDLTPAEQADFYELWLLTPDGKDPQSITKFTQDGGVIDVPVPAGVSTSKFPVVDISEEVDDGNEGHSGKSILRGSLA